MNSQVLKLNLIEQLIHLEDVKLLKRISEIIISASKNILPMSLDEFYTKINNFKMAYKNRDVFTVNQVREEVVEWKKPIKCFT